MLYMLRTFISLYINCSGFFSGRIRTLVAMATYSSKRRIMGKVEIDNCSVTLEIFEISFHRYVY